MVDVAHLPLAKLRTTHEFVESGKQTVVRFSIEVFGLLAFFWRRVVAEKQIKEAPSQTEALIRYARAH